MFVIEIVIAVVTHLLKLCIPAADESELFGRVESAIAETGIKAIMRPKPKIILGRIVQENEYSRLIFVIINVEIPKNKNHVPIRILLSKIVVSLGTIRIATKQARDLAIIDAPPSWAV